MNRVLKTVIFAYAAGLVVALFAGVVSREVVADEKTPENIGAEACKKCHFKQHKSWTKGKLAQAFEVLKPNQKVEEKKKANLDPAKDYTKDPKCLKCHTTDYGKPTGYPEIVEGKECTDAEKARMALNEGVTCEACHGPGSLYSVYKKDHKEYKLPEVTALGLISPPTEAQCAPCHVKECPTMADDYKFDFAAKKMSEDVHEHKELKYDHK